MYMLTTLASYYPGVFHNVCCTEQRIHPDPDTFCKLRSTSADRDFLFLLDRTNMKGVRGLRLDRSFLKHTVEEVNYINAKLARAPKECQIKKGNSIVIGEHYASICMQRMKAKQSSAVFIQVVNSNQERLKQFCSYA